MFLDANNLFCDAQTVTATADSANTIDLGPAIGTVGRNLNPAMKVFAQVVEGAKANETLTSVKCELKGSNDNSAFTTIADSGAVAKASLVDGYQLLKDIPYLSDTPYRYLKLVFTVAGTAATGIKVTGGIIKDGVDHITTAY